MIQTRELRVLFDGECGLCSRSVQFLFRHEALARFTFIPLQSPLGREIAADIGIDPDDPSSFAVLDSAGNVSLQSSGAFLALSHCRQPWRFLTSVAALLPVRLTDFCYDFVARRRLRLFGKADICDLEQGELASRLTTTRPH